MEPRKEGFKKQKIKLTETAKEKAIKEAQSILSDTNSTVKEKKRAQGTLDKIDNIEKSLKMAMSQTGGGGNERANLDVQRSFSSFFYDDTLEEIEKTDAFWSSMDTVSVGKVKMRMDRCIETNSNFIYFRKVNTQFNPTLMKISIYECEEFLAKLNQLLVEIEQTRPTDTIPFLANAFGRLDEKHPDFYNENVCISNTSGSMKVRPFISDQGSIRFRFLSPRPASGQYNWSGPSFRLQSIYQFKAVLKFLEYCIQKCKNEGIL